MFKYLKMTKISYFGNYSDIDIDKILKNDKNEVK